MLSTRREKSARSYNEVRKCWKREEESITGEANGDVGHKVTGIPTKYVVLPTTRNEERDKMFHLYNKTGTYPGVVLPDKNVLDLGVELHGLEQFVKERLVPHLGLASYRQRAEALEGEP